MFKPICFVMSRIVINAPTPSQDDLGTELRSSYSPAATISSLDGFTRQQTGASALYGFNGDFVAQVCSTYPGWCLDDSGGGAWILVVEVTGCLDDCGGGVGGWMMSGCSRNTGFDNIYLYNRYNISLPIY